MATRPGTEPAQAFDRPRAYSSRVVRDGSEATLDELVVAAVGGNADAWNQLVDRLERVVWKAVNMMTSHHDVRNDAFAATWLRLAERLGTIREPSKLPGWLTTTACNEVRVLLRQRDRQHLSYTAGGFVATTLMGDSGDHSARLELDDERQTVRAAFGRLDPGCRELLTVLVLRDQPVSYDEASRELGRPVGSLGPTRRRCLAKLKRLIDDVSTEDQPETQDGGA